MKKLYVVNFNYYIEANEKCWFRKKCIVNINREIYDYFMISEEDELEKNIRNIINNKIKSIELDIEEQGYTEIWDWGQGSLFDCRYVDINRVIDFYIDKFSYREATLQECIKKLTPKEFEEIYGNILKIGDLK